MIFHCSKVDSCCYMHIEIQEDFSLALLVLEFEKGVTFTGTGTGICKTKCLYTEYTMVTKFRETKFRLYFVNISRNFP
jgi:hypothetical protein